MNFLTEFHNSMSSQRKIIDYNNFFSFLLIGIFFARISIVFKYYIIYEPVIKIILILGLAGLFAGNLLGRLLYARYQNFRSIFIFSDISFILLVVLYFLLDTLKFDNTRLIVLLFFFLKFIIPFLIFITSLMIGLKIFCSSRISCGEIIGEKQSIVHFIGFMLFGVSMGVAAAGFFYSFNVPIIYLAVIPLLILPSTFLVNLRYNLTPLYVKDSEEEKEGKQPSVENRRTDKLIFTYLNFFYIILYAYMGFLSISKYYGDTLYVKLLFTVMLLLVMLAGYITGGFITFPNLYIYAESLFPAAFLVFLILLLRLYDSLHFVAGILLFIPAALVMGIVLTSTVRDIIEGYDNKLRPTVIEFATIMLPVPVLMSLSFINFTSFWYFIVLGVVMTLNVVVPAIYIVNSAIAGYKKTIYFFFSLIFIPLFIFIILYFNISLNSNVYVTRVGNFDVLRDVNYNADYIKIDATIKMNNTPVFDISDNVIRNYKRSLAPVSLYYPDNKKILFIDGNQKFFRNPAIGYFENSVCLDILSERDVDFNKLPLSGSQTYVPDNDDPLSYFQRNKYKFFTIVDIPNILDQNSNTFRFSEEYYTIIKKQLEDNGIFVQIFNISNCRQELFSFAVSNMRKSFKKHIIYFFSNIMVIFSSDSINAFDMKQENYLRLIKFFTTHGELSGVFLNEAHVLSHLLYTRIDDMLPFLSESMLMPALYLAAPDKLLLKPQLFVDYIGHNKKVLELIGKTHDQQYLLLTINNLFQPDDSILTLLKKIELAEIQENYKVETQLLFELKKLAEFRITLQEYIFKVLKYKEKYYYNLALQMEKNKKWEKAEELYKAVLLINSENFDANYRMGLLCITLQNIEGSFNYLQQAMRINKNHPKVLFQMGIIYFSIGKIQNAIDYFNKALQQNEKSSSIYRYLGLCYQNQGHLIEAENYLSKSLLADPNDVDTKSRLDEVRSQIQKENKKWETPEQKNESDVEQDAEMPLPVSKGAYDIRLKDNDNSLPIVDPQTGKTIQGAEEKKQ
jgi:tetratricopeptide (TPR) repeat protein